jgi:hypothetical protein
MATFFLCLMVFLGTCTAPILTMGVIMYHYGHTTLGTIMIVFSIVYGLISLLVKSK